MTDTADDQRERWNALYQRFGKLYGDYPSQLAYDVMRFIFSAFLHSENSPREDLSKLTALEIGGGYGRNARFIASWGISTTLLDISDEALAIARRDGVDALVTLVHGDITTKTFDRQFDVAYANFVFHMLDAAERRIAMGATYRALNDGAYFLGSFLSVNDVDFTKYDGTREIESRTFIVREKPQHFFTHAEVSDTLTDAGFRVRTLEEKEDPEAIMQVCRNTRYWFAIAQRGEDHG